MGKNNCFQILLSKMKSWKIRRYLKQLEERGRTNSHKKYRICIYDHFSQCESVFSELLRDPLQAHRKTFISFKTRSDKLLFYNDILKL